MIENNDFWKNLFIKLNYLIYSFDKFIEGIYSNKQENSSQKKYKGYIINLKDYQELKNNINYNKVKPFFSHQNIQRQQILQFCDINKIKKIKSPNQIEFKTPRYLFYMINNKESYIIINEEIWNFLNGINKDNKTNGSYIEYTIGKNNQLSINFENAENIIVWSGNNIINEYSYKYSVKSAEYKYLYEEYKNIIKDINSFYNLEEKFINSANKKDNNLSLKSGYLISNSWFNNWKKITNYEIIKILIKFNNNNNNDIISKEVINHLEKYNFKYSDLPPLEIFFFRTKSELEDFLIKDSLVIIDDDFKQSFKIKSEQKITTYYLNRNQIYLNVDKDMVFNIYKNKIISKEKLNIFFLKQFLRIVEYNPNHQKINSIYLINNKILDIFKNIFDYEKIKTFLMNNNISYNNNFDEYFLEILKIIRNDTKYMDNLRTINFMEELSNCKSDYNINKMHNEINLMKNQIINFDYFVDFILVNEDSLLFLNDINIINICKKCCFFKVNYIIKEEKILLMFKGDKNEYFYEIGYINSDRYFTIEYILAEAPNNQRKIEFYCKEYGINYLINNFMKEENKNEIKNKDDLIGYFLKIEDKPKIDNNNNDIIINNITNNNINIKNESLKNENDNFIIKIISILISFNSFEKEIKTKLKGSFNNNLIINSNNNQTRYFLINSNFIFQLKTLSGFNQMGQFIEQFNNNNYNNNQILNEIINNKNNISLVASNKKEIEKLFNLDNYKIEEKDYNSYLYINNFYILNYDSFAKLKELNCNIDLLQKYEVNLGFNSGKILIKIKNNPKKFENSNYYIFIYTFEQKFAEIINYKIHSLIIYNNINEINNDFMKLINQEKYENFIEKIDLSNNKIKYILLDNKETKEKIDIENEDFYIIYNIFLFNEYSKIWQNNEKLFLINRNYMQELESMLYFNEIKQIVLSNNQIQAMNIYNSKEEKRELLKAIKNILGENIIQEIKNIKKENIEIKLSQINILNIQNYVYENENVPYFVNCQIINENICSLIQKLIPNINIDKQCYINNNKIYSRLNKETICFGELEQNNIFKVNYIIYSKVIFSIDKIMNNLFIFGINSIQTNSFPPQVILIELFKQNNSNLIINNINFNNTNNFSNKLLSLVYLSFFSQKKTFIQNNSINKVVLLNKRWLYQHHFDKISQLVKQANIQSIPSNINDIITKLDITLLTQINQKLPNISTIDSSILAEYEIIQLKNKKIKLYKEFIMIKFESFKIFINEFNGNNNVTVDIEMQMGYTNKQGEDIIFISNNNSENNDNYIFIGKISEISNIYEIQFILDYNSINNLLEQIKLITNSNLNNYFKENIILNNNDNNDLLGPIIYKNKIIGDCYKYFSNINDYTNYIDYTALLENNIFKNSIKLYFNYQKIISNIKNNKSDLELEKYYLVNKAFISQIKKDLNFFEFCSYLKKGGVLNDYEINNFNAIQLFKHTPLDSLKYFFANNNNNFDNYYSSLEIDIISVKYQENNNEKYVMIYNDYELIDEETIELFVDLNRIKNYLVKCAINEGKIIVLFSKNFDHEKRGISALGKINDDLSFVEEYILVYDDVEIRKMHTEFIYGNLNNYISNFQFVNHCLPIHDNQYKIVGTVIDYIKYDNTYNINNPIQSPNSINHISNQNINSLFAQNNNNFKAKTTISKSSQKLPKGKENIKDYYYSPTLIGLQNIGATCYMNATLQCLCNIDKLVNFFKYSKQAKDIYQNNMKNTLSYSFKILVDQLWPDDQKNVSAKYCAPYDFKEKISKMNPLFEGIQANDSKDLVNFIIMTLHEELNKVNSANSNMEGNSNIDQRNKELIFAHFMKEFTEKNQSIISDLFYGVNCSITQCQNQNCLSKLFNYQIYFFIIFPLEEVRKFKMQYDPNVNDLLDIYDCFNYNQKIDIMAGDNAMYCNYCMQTCTTTMSTILTVTPEVLIIILNRGKGIQYNIKISFYEDLILDNFVEHKETGSKYKLIGVITHLGQSDMSGHFIAYCKEPISNNWYKYNDAMVNHVKDFQREVINFAMPYLLFYQKS